MFVAGRSPVGRSPVDAVLRPAPIDELELTKFGKGRGRISKGVGWVGILSVRSLIG